MARYFISTCFIADEKDVVNSTDGQETWYLTTATPLLHNAQLISSFNDFLDLIKQTERGVREGICYNVCVKRWNNVFVKEEDGAIFFNYCTNILWCDFHYAGDGDGNVDVKTYDWRECKYLYFSSNLYPDCWIAAMTR